MRLALLVCVVGVLGCLPHSLALVVFEDAPSSGQADPPTGNSKGDAQTARSMLPVDMDKEAIMVTLCEGQQDRVTDCRDVPTVRERYGGSRPGAFALRRKRQASWFGFGNSFHNPQSFNNVNHGWPSHPNAVFNNHVTQRPAVNPVKNNFHHPGALNHPQNVLFCPNQLNQSDVYEPNPDAANYPAGDIGNELNARPALRACLDNEIVFSDDPPPLVVEDFQFNSNESCPTTQLQMYSYTNPILGSKCWIMQNFQEDVLYKVCASRFPLKSDDCKKNNTFNNHQRYDPWFHGSSSFGNFGFGHQPTRPNQIDTTVDLCVKEFRRVSVWAYCEGLPLGQRIIRDRIIITQSCSSQSVPCTRRVTK